MFYWYMPRFAGAALNAATLSAGTAFAASITIAHRMALLSDPQALWGARVHSEAVRMVAEKLDAAAEGALQASLVAGRLAMRSATGRLSTDEVAKGLVAVGLAATRPAARRARANARRLTKS